MKESKPLFSNRQLFQLLWPLLVEQLLNVLVGMVDVVMVASIGEAAVSGVSLVDSINQLMIQFLGALTAGGTVVCSQFVGMKDMKKAAQSAGQLFLLTISGAVMVVFIFLFGGEHLLRLIFGQVEVSVMSNAYIYFIITTFSFPFLALYNSSASLFRAVGNSRISMKISMLMNGMNVIGNAICIYGLKMGVTGVALPTLISRMIAAVLLFVLLQRSEGEVKVQRFSDLKPQGKMIRRILGIGIPGGIESGIFQFGKLMLQSLVSTLGTSAIAGFAVASNLVMFLYLPGNSLGIGLTTVVGQCVGAREAEQAKAYTKKFVYLNYAFLAVLATGLGLGRYFWIGIYNLSQEAAYMAAGLVISHCIMMIVWPLAFLIPYTFRAANDAKFTMIVSISCMWIFRVALAYIFVKGFHLSIFYVWYAMYIDWIARVFIYWWRMKGFLDRVKKIEL